MSNPLLEPIHGINLQDYGAACSKIASGVSDDAICKALGIEKPIWDEANTIWVKRMQQDSTFEVVTLFGQYFGEANEHPKLGSLGASHSPETQANIDKLNTDRYYYEELCGARQAAYQYGLDGAQWIMDTTGISLGEFQNAAMKWMNVQNNELNIGNSNYVMHFVSYQRQMQQQYAAKFAAEQGGNVADDVAF